VLTLGTSYKLWSPGTTVALSGLTAAAFLNGQTVTILAAPTPYSFTAAFTHANYATAADTGTAAVVNGQKSTYMNLAAYQTARTAGQHVPLNIGLSSYGNGDAIAISSQQYCYGGASAPGDEQCEVMSAGASAGFPALTASVASISGNTVTLSCTGNCAQLGEQQPLLNTSRGGYSAGTVASIGGAPPVIAGVGTSWASLCPGGVAPCAPANLWFEFTGEPGYASGVHMAIPIQTITSNTSATLVLNAQGSNNNYPGLAGSGGYVIYQGSPITAVGYVTAFGSGSTLTATVMDATQFQVGDHVLETGAPMQGMRWAHGTLTQNVPEPGTMAGALMNLISNGRYPKAYGLNFVQSGGIKVAAFADDWSGAPSTTAAPDWGVYLKGMTPVLGAFYADDPADNNVENMVETKTSGGAGYDSIQYDRTPGSPTVNSWRMQHLALQGVPAATLLGTDGYGNIVPATNISNSVGGIGIYQNLLTYSQFDAGNAAWVTAVPGGGYPAATVTANTSAVTDPAGTNSAEQVVIPGSLPGGFQGQAQVPSPGLTNGLPYTFSIYLRGAAGGEQIRLSIGYPSTYGCEQSGLYSATTSWVRYQFTCTPAAGMTQSVAWESSTPGATIYAWGAELEQALAAGIYIRSIASPVAPTAGLAINGVPVTASAVASIFGRTGAVTAQSGDYTAAQVGADPSGTAAAVQSNLNAEATARGSADAVNATAIANETARAETAEAGKAAANASTTVNGQTCALGGACTVPTGLTSVGVTPPTTLLSGGTAITANGSVSLGLTNAAQNAVWAGPASGGTGAPGYRGLALADLPAGISTQVVLSQSSDVANTGFTAQQTLCSLAIPANTTSGTQDGTLSRWSAHASVTTSGTGSMGIYTGMSNASSTMSGGYSSMATETAGRTYSIDIICHNRTGSSQICEQRIGSSTNSLATGSSTPSLSVGSAMYFVVQGTQTVSTDATTCRLMEVTVK
jgi:hypothetical protein